MTGYLLEVGLEQFLGVGDSKILLYFILSLFSIFTLQFSIEGYT